MPPKNATGTATTRKGPQFKPPRPVKAAAQTSAATKRASAGTAKKASAPAAAPAPATIISSDEEIEEEDDFDDDDIMQDVIDPPPRPTTPPTLSTPNPIPAPLLARLLYENFEGPNTQIQKGAMNLVGKYMEIFVREAFARAKEERKGSVRDGGGIGDGFLQVEDLERVGAQLVLDF
jgi:hypothetical protein